MTERETMKTAFAQLPIAELLMLASGTQEADGTWAAIRELQTRGGDAEIRATLQLADSPRPEDRVAAAHILGQFGFRTGGKADDCVDVLLRLLLDEASVVVVAAATAFSHRSDTRAVAPLVALAGHPDEQIRRGVVHGLGGKEDRRATDALISLSKDHNPEIRDWAVFALGQLTELDYPELREALAERLGDEHEDARIEAACGLAQRKDARATGILANLVVGDGEGLSAAHFDAIAALDDPAFLPKLEAIRAQVHSHAHAIDAYWLSCLERAIGSLSLSR